MSDKVEERVEVLGSVDGSGTQVGDKEEEER